MTNRGNAEHDQLVITHVNHRKELVIVCLILAFAAGVFYDTWYIISLGGPGLRTMVAAAVVACFGTILLLTIFPQRIIQPALLAAWPLHLFTICFLVWTYCFHGGAQLGTVIAYTIVAYATYLLVPLCLLLDRRLFDAFVTIVIIGSALLAIPSFIGAMGVDYILGIPLSNKPSYSQFSGLIASGGVFEYAEGHALQMSIGLFCCIYAVRKTRSWFYVVCLVMVLGGLVVSQGRGAIFGVVIAGVFCLLPELFRRSRPLFLGSLVLFLIFPFVIWTALAEIPGVANYLRLQRGLSGRDVAWAYAISVAEEQPWTGHGFGTSGEISEDARKQLGRSGYSGAGTTFHNTFITKAVELGIVATSLYALLYIVPLIRICEPSRDRYLQDLIRSVVILTITASLFRDYNIGGVRSTALLTAVFLGIANLWIVFANREPTSQNAGKTELAHDTIMPPAEGATY